MGAASSREGVHRLTFFGIASTWRASKVSKVFISYSRADSTIVDHLCSRLNQAGHQVWLDREKIGVGRQWRSELVQAIRDCSIFILVLSPNSARSQAVLKELTLAEESGRAIIPIEIAEFKIPSHFEYHLAGTQRLSLKGGLDVGLPGLLEAMIGAPERAAATSARFDRVMSELDAEYTGTMGDAAALDQQKLHVMEELARLDMFDARRGYGDSESSGRRDHLLRKLDEIEGCRRQKRKETGQLHDESMRQMEETGLLLRKK